MQKLSARTWVYIGAAVIVILGFLVWYSSRGTSPSSPAQSQQGQGQNQQLPSGGTPQPVHAPAGQLTPGFNSSMIVDKNATIVDSYNIPYGNGKQYTAVYDSSSSMKTIFNGYKTYFNNNGWTILNQAAPTKTSASLYAEKGRTQAAVAISAISGGTQVVIGY